MSDSQKVRVKYSWDIRRRMILSVIVHKLRRPIRFILRGYDWIFYGYKAEGFEDLTLREWLRIKKCERRKEHYGRRIALAAGAHYCDYCQCHWGKFNPRYKAGKRVR